MLTCCFIGHREVDNKESLFAQVTEEAERLIIVRQADTFLFGGKGVFNSLCLQAVSGLKQKYPYNSCVKLPKIPAVFICFCHAGAEKGFLSPQ